MTVFPESVQTFPTMQNLTQADMLNVKAYQQAMEDGNFALAAQYLALIPNAANKIVNADYINTIVDTIEALENYTQGYVLSPTQPISQVAGDWWFKVV